ncbi:hypothetical protein [Frankia sp. EAN1pec]|uniref:hypothetical protein n=1 Tax=Parafrankia sp. (strain EAN1pec) TaxID=298653 RepID=UPI00059D2679
MLPTWKQLSPDDGTYAALCPFGWTTYKAGNPAGPPVMVNTDLKHFPMDYIQPPGRYIPEIGDVWPGTTYMATAAAVHIGHSTGDEAPVAKALKMSEAVANQIFDEGERSTKGYAFGTGILVRGRGHDLPVHRLHPSPLSLATRRRARHHPSEIEIALPQTRKG